MVIADAAAMDMASIWSDSLSDLNEEWIADPDVDLGDSAAMNQILEDVKTTRILPPTEQTAYMPPVWLQQPMQKDLLSTSGADGGNMAWQKLSDIFDEGAAGAAGGDENRIPTSVKRTHDDVQKMEKPRMAGIAQSRSVSRRVDSSRFKNLEEIQLNHVMNRQDSRSGQEMGFESESEVVGQNAAADEGMAEEETSRQKSMSLSGLISREDVEEDPTELLNEQHLARPMTPNSVPVDTSVLHRSPLKLFGPSGDAYDSFTRENLGHVAAQIQQSQPAPKINLISPRKEKKHHQATASGSSVNAERLLQEAKQEMFLLRKRGGRPRSAAPADLSEQDSDHPLTSVTRESDSLIRMYREMSLNESELQAPAASNGLGTALDETSTLPYDSVNNSASLSSGALDMFGSIENFERDDYAEKVDQPRDSPLVEEHEEKAGQNDTLERKPSFDTWRYTSEEISTFSRHKRQLCKVLNQSGISSWPVETNADLSDRGLETIDGLSEFLPRLKALKVARNRLTSLQDAPPDLCELYAHGNQMSEAMPFPHLPRLMSLNLAGNMFTSLHGFRMLYSLQRLSLDGNQLTSLSGLEELTGLNYLSVSGNKIESVQFSRHAPPHLRVLRLNDNGMLSCQGLEHLKNLEHLNLSNNQLLDLGHIDSHVLPKLHTLIVNDNELEHINFAAIPAIERLEADNNRISRLYDISQAMFLSLLSLCRQRIAGTPGLIGIEEHSPSLCELLLTGTCLSMEAVETPMVQESPLRMIALQGCGVVHVPCLAVQSLVMHINLRDNAISSLAPLAYMRNLRSIVARDNAISDMHELLTVVKSLPCLMHLDLRGNPLTMTFYPAYVPGNGWLDECNALHDQPTWAERHGDDYDHYRSVVLQACPHLRILDGISTRALCDASH